ncbi:hypothetical protein C8A05DRAFT_16643 [Staphylotrichum tortipilum]|uniref:Uncharacterized protein n=1 Tax=Staphylotrichum tortipilum TaxID=2831512 RepID=A0AAN6MHT1_9PEZI|nr:hypothetical protein C8A05DRAFT_16643 [Staphylotrichum longicolle]
MQQHRTDHAWEHVSAAHRLGGRQFKPPAPPRVPDGQLDPDDLTRRLYAVLAERKAHAERKQRAQHLHASRKEGRGQPGAGNRPRDDAKPAPRQHHHKPADPPTDLITELKRAGSATTKPPPAATADPAPDADGTAPPPQYRHVPQEAAKQFTRTTTVENMRNSDHLVHKLSKRALKFHTEGAGAPRTTRAETALAPAELSRALQHTQTQRERHLDRNQFQRTRILEEAVHLDEAASSPTTQKKQHTFEAEIARLLPTRTLSKSLGHARRNSTGNAADLLPASHNPHPPYPLARHSLVATDPSLLGLMLDPLAEDPSQNNPPSPPPEELGRFPPPDRARVDWSQSDERTKKGRMLLGPWLRKADSLWGLRRGSRDSDGGGDKEKGSHKGGSDKGSEKGGKRGSEKGSHRGGSEKGSSKGEKGSEKAGSEKGEEVPASPRTGKGGFFGRFKR